ncbi:RND family efflux transporter, MFP subunit [Granulicella rosea]|uniref:RND family efflux transporter, MFP subunit n=1 Tax=Granulicella rosea TaxID=474952 RepID=A0A239CST8_9BACT|nr:efflux RND transporter periplasmic adaptor subunit [Granulicella rosea]SNS23147.1 RND family efflux transporter, MFP subunit [Granulicella rosea]
MTNPETAHTTRNFAEDSDPNRLDVPANSAGGPETPRKGLSGGFWIAIVLIAIAIAAVVVYGVFARKEDERKLNHQASDDSIPSVFVTHPATSRLSNEVALPGNTQAYVDTPIYSRTDGYLKSWYFDIGAHVKKGQLMAVIETPELDQQLQVAEAQLKSSQANLDLANITSNRYQNLLKSNSVSKQETDQAMGDAAAKQAAVEASTAAVRRLQQLQSFERVYAPFDGVVTVRNTDIGQLVQGGSSNALFHLASIGTIRVFVPVPESYAGALKDGSTADLTLDEFPNKHFTGTIARNSNAIDPASRTLNVEVDVDNAAGLLLPGAYVVVHFKVPDHGENLTLPSNTVIFRAQGMQVAVVRDNHIVLVPITVTHDGGATLEISSGPKATDNVVLDPSDSIATGQEVRIAQKKTDTPAAAKTEKKGGE